MTLDTIIQRNATLTKLSTALEDAKSIDPPALQKSRCDCGTVLIADDEIFNNIVLEGILMSFDNGKLVKRVDKVNNGTQAISYIINNSNGTCCQSEDHIPY